MGTGRIYWRQKCRNWNSFMDFEDCNGRFKHWRNSLSLSLSFSLSLSSVSLSLFLCMWAWACTPNLGCTLLVCSILSTLFCEASYVYQRTPSSSELQSLCLQQGDFISRTKRKGPSWDMVHPPFWPKGSWEMRNPTQTSASHIATPKMGTRRKEARRATTKTTWLDLKRRRFWREAKSYFLKNGGKSCFSMKTKHNQL